MCSRRGLEPLDPTLNVRVQYGRHSVAPTSAFVPRSSSSELVHGMVSGGKSPEALVIERCVCLIEVVCV